MTPKKPVLQELSTTIPEPLETARHFIPDVHMSMPLNDSNTIENLSLNILNLVSDAIIITDQQARISKLNSAACKLLGYRPEELIGRKVWVLCSPDTSYQEIIEKLHQDIHQNYHHPNLHVVTKSHSEISTEATVQAIQGGEQGCSYLWLLRDAASKQQTEATLELLTQRLFVAREEERQRIARELHERTTNDLISLAEQLKALAQLEAPMIPTTILERIRAMRSQTSNMIKQLRSFISDLRPLGLETFGLNTTLKNYLAQLENDTDGDFPDVSLDLCEIDKLAFPICLCLFRGVQEAMHNIVKHANADCVLIKTRLLDQSIMLSIEDNGQGFDVPADLNIFAKSQQFGLLGLAERLDLLDGTLVVRSQRGMGTDILLTIPCDMPLP